MKEHSNQNVFSLLALGAIWNRTRVIKTFWPGWYMHVRYYYYFIFFERSICIGFWRLKKLQTWTLYWMGGHIIFNGRENVTCCSNGRGGVDQIPSVVTHTHTQMTTIVHPSISIRILQYVCVCYFWPRSSGAAAWRWAAKYSSYTHAHTYITRMHSAVTSSIRPQLR
jgi:hypothetical protein